MHVAEIQLRRRVGGVELDGRLEPARGLGLVHGFIACDAALVLEEPEDGEVRGV